MRAWGREEVGEGRVKFATGRRGEGEKEEVEREGAVEEVKDGFRKRSRITSCFPCDP